jgi:segregation and condensation protein A
MNVTIDEQMSYIADLLRIREDVRFFEMISHMTEKIRIIVTVIAMLEMVKNRLIGIRPADYEDDFIVYKLRTETY